MDTRLSLHRLRSGSTGVHLFLVAVAALVLLAGCNSDDIHSLPEARIVPLFAGDRNGDILLVDQRNGAATPVLNTSYTGADVGVLSAMVYRPQSHTIYLGIGGSSPSCPGCILTLNPSTGVASLELSLCAIQGLAVAPGTGNMRMFACDTFFSFDPLTATATSIVPNPTTGLGFGLSYALNGTLYVAVGGGGVSTLWTLDPVSGASTLVGSLTFVGNSVIDPFVPANGKIVSMTTHPTTGVLFALLNDGSGGAGPTYLITINPATLVAKLIGQTQGGLDGLAFLPHL